ncbi:NUDIX hydrolase [Hazenella sp. IB182357]|uniref:NUDIX hydrolase n=1 Tax=Polycladospora coralii TaxID=2771432 RepID=A0A926NGM3_9BACL|nr:NUDIX hydrolase [Polycladospora coralii]MBD1372978.1 NUDIX hydrolase [Polycladospora coralii]MBS7530963.1 NUDIX hydrolase [Polycladospora coralii]
MNKFEEKTITTESIYSGKVVHLQIDEVLLPNGKKSKREIVKHPGAVGVVAITEEQKILLVRQFRKALEKTILEIPAGKLEPGEDPATCAIRELEEETGYCAMHVRPIASFYTSPGFADELLYVYQAEQLTLGQQHTDDDEFVEVVSLTLDECFASIQKGEICDAKTVLAIYHWQLLK